jgi:hypothetical protein
VYIFRLPERGYRALSCEILIRVPLYCRVGLRNQDMWEHVICQLEEVSTNILSNGRANIQHCRKCSSRPKQGVGLTGIYSTLYTPPFTYYQKSKLVFSDPITSGKGTLQGLILEHYSAHWLPEQAVLRRYMSSSGSLANVGPILAGTIKQPFERLWVSADRPKVTRRGLDDCKMP